MKFARFSIISLIGLTALTGCTSDAASEAQSSTTASASSTQPNGYGWEGYWVITGFIDQRTVTIGKLDAHSKVTDVETVHLFGVTPAADQCATEQADYILERVPYTFSQKAYRESEDQIDKYFATQNNIGLLWDETEAGYQKSLKKYPAKYQAYTTENIDSNLRPFNVYDYMNVETRDEKTGYRKVVINSPLQKEVAPGDDPRVDGDRTQVGTTAYPLDTNSLNGYLLMVGLAVPNAQDGEKNTYWYDGRPIELTYGGGGGGGRTIKANPRFHDHQFSPLFKCGMPSAFLEAAYGKEAMQWFYDESNQNPLKRELTSEQVQSYFQ